MMTNAEMAMALNEWMRRFIEDPRQFAHDFEWVNRFLAEQNEGREPSYGEVSALYMQQLFSELTAKSA